MKLCRWLVLPLLLVASPAPVSAHEFDIYWFHTSLMSEMDAANDLVILHHHDFPTVNSHMTVSDFFDFESEPLITAVAGRSTTGTVQTVSSSSTYTPVELNDTFSESGAEIHDPNNLLDNSKLFVSSPGAYSFQAVVELDTASLPSAAYRYGIRVEKTTTTSSDPPETVTLDESISANKTTIRRLQLSGLVTFPDTLNFAEDNYIQLKVSQESGGNLDLKVDALTPRFSIRKLEDTP